MNILATQYKDSWEVESFECIVDKNNKNDIASLKKSVSCRDSSTWKIMPTWSSFFIFFTIYSSVASWQFCKKVPWIYSEADWSIYWMLDSGRLPPTWYLLFILSFLRGKKIFSICSCFLHFYLYLFHKIYACFIWGKYCKISVAYRGSY